MTDHEAWPHPDSDPEEPECVGCGLHLDLTAEGWVHGGRETAAEQD